MKKKIRTKNSLNDEDEKKRTRKNIRSLKKETKNFYYMIKKNTKNNLLSIQY